jgi:hypothetical protein
MHPQEQDLVTFDLAQRFLQLGGGEGEEILLERIRADVAGGSRSLADVVDELGSDFLEQPGEFGLDQAASLLLPLALPAIRDFVKVFAKKFVETTAEKVAGDSYSTLRDSIARRLSQAPASDAAWIDLEAAFAKRAEELRLPASSYRDLLASARNNPTLLL